MHLCARFLYAYWADIQRFYSKAKMKEKTTKEDHKIGFQDR